MADVFGWRGLSTGGTSVKVFQNGDWPCGNLPQWLCQPVKSDFDLAADRNFNRMAALANTVTHTHTLTHPHLQRTSAMFSIFSAESSAPSWNT